MRRILISFAAIMMISNFLLVWVYDDYYLPYIDEQLAAEEKQILNGYVEELEDSITQLKKQKLIDLKHLSKDKAIDLVVKPILSPGISSFAIGELASKDKVIDPYNDDGPVAYVKLNEVETLIIGPIEASYLQAAGKEPLFILTFLCLNIGGFFWLFQRLAGHEQRLKGTLDSVLKQEPISAFQLGKLSEESALAERIYKVQQHISQLSITNQQILDDQRDMMHAVAHELRSPIARFSFALDILEQTQDESRRATLVKDMSGSVEELDALVSEILTYSRLADDNVELHLMEFELSDAILDTIKKIKTLYPGVHIDLEECQKDIRLTADLKLLQRAVTNLLRNAARYAKKNILVRISCTDAIRIVVDDDGLGIPPGKRERIFEPFTRLDASRSRDSGGAGLGLSIVKSVCNKHQAYCYADESPAGGARFVIELPLESDQTS